MKPPAPSASVVSINTARPDRDATMASTETNPAETIPLCLASEKEDLGRRLNAVKGGEESLLVLDFENFFSSGLDFQYICSIMLCANALTMWKTGGAVTRLLVLSGDVSMQGPGQIYGFANQFRSLMQGGYGRIDNAAVWMDQLGVSLDLEPLDLRDFRRAVRVFTAARVSPDQVRSLTNAEWYFGFRIPGARDVERGHFDYDVQGSHSIRIASGGGAMNIEFQDRFTSGPCEIMSSPRNGCYKLSLDLTGIRAPLSGSDAAKYLDVFSSLIGAGSDWNS